MIKQGGGLAYISSKGTVLNKQILKSARAGGTILDKQSIANAFAIDEEIGESETPVSFSHAAR